MLIVDEQAEQERESKRLLRMIDGIRRRRRRKAGGGKVFKGRLARVARCEVGRTKLELDEGRFVVGVREERLGE